MAIVKQEGTRITNLVKKPSISRWEPELGKMAVCFNEDTHHLVVGKVVDFLPYGAEFIDRNWADGFFVIKDIETGKKSHWPPARVTPYEAAPFWRGTKPTLCDICRKTFTNGIMIDGRTARGPWGLLCETCHAMHGCGVGTGCGQKYMLNEKTQRWFKIEG